MNDAFVNYMHNNRFYQQIQNAGFGIDNMLPYLPRGAVPGSDYEEKQRARMKARQSMGLSNINTNNLKQFDRSKSKQNINSKDIKDGKKDDKNEVPSSAENKNTE